MFSLEWFKLCLILSLWVWGSLFITAGVLYKNKYAFIGLAMWGLIKLIN